MADGSDYHKMPCLDLGIGHIFEIHSLSTRISTKPSLLEIGIQAFNDIVTLLLKLDETFGFVE